MLTKNDIRIAVLDRLNALDASCNSTHITHNFGVLRGLLWALNGSDPGALSTAMAEDILKLAGIPCHDAPDNQIEHATPGDPDWPTD